MSAPQRAARRFDPIAAVVNLVRGALIGLAELVPGVSGGTIALIAGIYEPLINSADHVVNSLKHVVTGKFGAARTELAKAHWSVVIPALLGMGLIVVTMAGVMKVFVTDTPQLARSLFLGMVVASVAVPLMGVKRQDVATNRQRAILGVVFVVAAIGAFLLTGLGSGTTIENPPAWLVFGAASVAICALVLPGISGSFMLLIFGLYAPTVAAVNDRNLGYLALFAAGAAVGLGLFVKGLNWLLEHQHALTMAVMSGLLLGSLRALWPWNADGTPLAPDAPWPALLGLALTGAAVVGVIVWVDRRLNRQ
ncbi:MAG: DUF368 domain-containing protein [Propionibacteriaceae bacterium]|nr:DUF368 domain-containing protein [Propionibacteriaceae bacterium]